MKFLVFLIACHGLTQIVTGGKIFERPRTWIAKISKPIGYWICCPMCFGLAAGAALAAVGLWPGQLTVNRWVDLFIAGVTGSAFCWAMHVVLHKLDADKM